MGGCFSVLDKKLWFFAVFLEFFFICFDLLVLGYL